MGCSQSRNKYFVDIFGNKLDNKCINELMKSSKKSSNSFSLDGLSIIVNIVDVYDGDTLTVAMHNGHNAILFKVRANGYDSCEMKPLLLDSKRDEHKKKAIDARNRFIVLLGFEEDKYSPVLLKCHKFDKYGRVLADIYNINNSETSINSIMIKEKHGCPYNGGTKNSTSI